MTLLRFLSVIVLIAFVPACVQYRLDEYEQVPESELQVSWEELGTESLDVGGVEVRALVVTPSQWPLEESLKRLSEGDFQGFYDALNLDWKSSTLPEGTLEDLFDEGYLPAFVRVGNGTEEPHPFLATRLGVELDGSTYLRPVNPDTMPRLNKSVDWSETSKATAIGVLYVALILLIIAAALKGKCGGCRFPDHGPPGSRTRAGFEIDENGSSIGLAGEGPGDSSASGLYRPVGHYLAESGLIWKTVLQPGEIREGIVFFRLDGPVYNWNSARLVGF